MYHIAFGKEAILPSTICARHPSVSVCPSVEIIAIPSFSHLPQVASKGTAHFVVYKRDGRTSITRLSEAERVTEIAKMLSGSEITDAAVAQARILLGRRETEAQAPREAAPAAPKGKESGLLF